MNKKLPSKTIDSILSVLSGDVRVLFAFLYGSSFEDEKGNDIDIAVYATPEENYHALSSDLKIALLKKTGLPPDDFDIQILNGIVEHGDVFDLIYLKSVLNNHRFLINKNSEVFAEFLERYGTRFRECEGLMQEVLT